MGACPGRRVLILCAILGGPSIVDHQIMHQLGSMCARTLLNGTALSIDNAPLVLNSDENQRSYKGIKMCT